ncbi:uncharacterized protein LOC131737166 isoform X2 [Acipenser ruthenus]|uniref:uncharacterized protein LOC131737166 isoform X2 n=1 Tax=Acipenser ruthenus TaxID=7906 RepID=UPI002741D2C4|nr:uncharacterized protein LOC131737166 isoform X2 [Acipenser ruthenus]
MLHWVSPMIYYISVMWLLCSINCETHHAVRGAVDPDLGQLTSEMEPTLHGFFPLRSCHVTMFEDYGDLFSPVFLGSNPPPIWCNWTIVADQGKQIILHLYQFASKENCEMNEDQIIFEEFPARMEKHTLNGCWNEQFYTSQSNILYVFWLSMGSPSIGNGGFYGNYDIFEDNLPIDKTALPILHQIRGTPPVDREDNIIKNLKDKKSSLGNEMEETTEHFVQNLTPSMTSVYIESPSFLLHEERSHIPTTVEQSPLPLGQLGENSASAALYLLSTTSFPTQSTWSEAFSTEDHEDISKTGHTKLYKHLTTQSETEYLESYKHDQHPQITTPNAIESQAEYPESNRDQHSQRITTPMESETKYVQKYKHDQHLQKRTTPNEIEKYLNYKHNQHAKEREKEHQENKHDQHLQRITTPNTMGNEEEYFGSYKHDQHVIERETEFLGNYRRQQITTPNAVERETEYVGNGRDQHSQRISPNAMAKEEEYLENVKHDQRLQRITTSNAMESAEQHLEKDWHVMAGKAVSKRFHIVNPTESETLFRTVHLQSKLPEIQSEALDFGDLEAMAALDLRGDLELEPTRVQSFSLESMFLGMHDTPAEERFVVDAQPLNKARLEDVDGVCSSCELSRVFVVATSGEEVVESLIPTSFADKFKQSQTFADKSNSAPYLPISTANYLETVESNQTFKNIRNSIEVSRVVFQSRVESLDGGEDHEISPILTNRESTYRVNGDKTGSVTPGLLEEAPEINQQLKFTTHPSESNSSLKQDGIEVQIQTGKLWTNAAWEESVGTTDSVNRSERNTFAEIRVNGASPLEPLHEGPTSIAHAFNVSDGAYRSHRNVTPLVHFPGEYLFEVSIEMQINHTGSESLEDLERTLLILLENLIQDDLKHLHPPKSIALKRVKRLKSGLLFILWLHFGFGGRSMHLLIQSYLQRLVNRPVAELGTKNALVSSVSTEDVNECSTEMLLCDAHADCFNDFGTYTCRCQDGFEDRSRAGLGGTICVNVAGSKSPTLLEALTGSGFVLIVFLLLSMVVLAVVYKRQQQGEFVHCDNLESAVSQQCLQTHSGGLHQKGDLVEPKECGPREGLPLTQLKYFCGSERIGSGMSGNTQGDDLSIADEHARL